jgi:hypothetical protein
MGPDRVVDDPVSGGFAFEVLNVVNIDTLEALVFDRSEEPLDHAVGPRRLLPRADMDQMSFRSDPRRKADGFETGPVVGDKLQFVDFTGVGVGEILDPGDPHEGLDLTKR